MLSDRKKMILKAVIENYSKKIKPIGSKLLTSLPYLKFSSATIRYDMVELEKEGYLIKNHKSSGRIPSLQGYIFYLKNLMTRKDSKAPFQIISLFEKILNKKNLNKDSILKEVLELLCNLTDYVTMGVIPNVFKTNKVSKISFILLDNLKAMVIIITDKGNLRYQNIFLSKKEYFFLISKIEKITEFLNNLLFNKYLFEALKIIQSDIIQDEIKKRIFKYPENLIKFLIEVFYLFTKSNSYIYGISNFVNKYNFVNDQIMKEIMKMFDSQELQKVFLNFSNSNNNIYKLVNQITLWPYSEFIIISIPYKISKNEKGFIGILGPIIMKYNKIIPILEYLSAHLTYLFEERYYKQL
ncbi:heat-inducible transcription repressor HrcA [Candidatus Phytoplasma oryzae]|uniref:Heat-inducible transcription repressor HrcA n=1 Tax=Candidatus Phytoplasma oryzae TaxID=203274 RepID=A0A139JQZ6_9MOLU|nr:heat-inducible transcriptional repressor HrcA [Candidatus Phytoplasma oryzae]KXT29264.1 heat-inducible transcription repressor HrcA [Candidatus Phytoplasma oryzae]RAM57848.1 HrcA family transcriptional regulator [Candidatus Phytoplasma oryzae]